MQFSAFPPYRAGWPDPAAVTPAREALERVLARMPPVAIAVSGGVDSLTLAAAAQTVPGLRTELYHAVSPAVPAEATARTRDLAAAHGWNLVIIDAGEFDDPQYRANPHNRCFYCKTGLYGAIARRSGAQILSGTNTDDLGEYRPGLAAASAHLVRHPYVEAGIDKAGVRVIASALGLPAIATLPAAPCLSSRVETGLRIDPVLLRAVHAAERLVEEALRPRTVRCRIRGHGVVIELDAPTLAELAPAAAARLADRLRPVLAAASVSGRVSFAPYRNGSAFLRPPA